MRWGRDSLNEFRSIISYEGVNTVCVRNEDCNLSLTLPIQSKRQKIIQQSLQMLFRYQKTLFGCKINCLQAFQTMVQMKGITFPLFKFYL